MRAFTVPGLSTGPGGMVADAINNLLYIGDFQLPSAQSKSFRGEQKRRVDVESTWHSKRSVLDPCRQHSRGITELE